VPPRFERTEMKTFDEEGLRTFLDAVRDTPYYHLFYLSLFTGLRPSELLALRWDDADLDLGHLYVSRGLTRTRGQRSVVRTPKSPKGRRMVALPPSAALILREHKESQSAQRLLLGLPLLNGSNPVFSRMAGSPMMPDTVTHAWRRLARRSGFRGIRLHDRSPFPCEPAPQTGSPPQDCSGAPRPRHHRNYLGYLLSRRPWASGGGRVSVRLSGYGIGGRVHREVTCVGWLAIR